MKLAYYGSAFDNENTALRWDNPFSPLAAGADRGELALPPDNEFHQITVAAGYRISDATRTSAQLSVGRMEQNQDFLSATTNPNLTVSALPRSSLDGRVDTLNAALKLTSRWSDAWGFNAAYRHDDRDNKTPRASYDWVSTDTFVASPRENQPYSFTKRTVDLSTDYRASPTAKMVFGFEHENTERDLQEVAESRENTVRIKVIARPSNDVNVDAQLARARRDVSTYEVVAATQPPQNPLLRKYNVADRARTSADLNVSVSPSQTWQYGFGVGVANDDYTGSEVGLTESRSGNVNANVSVLITPVSSLHMFVDHQVMDSAQAGSNAFSVADWFARTKDTINTVGVGVTHRLQDKPLEVGADYTVSDSQSEISVNVGPFPTLKANLHSLQLHTTYFLEKGGNIRAGYRYETFRADDWMLDNVAPDTVSNVVLLGEQAPAYEVHVLTLSTRWEFD